MRCCGCSPSGSKAGVDVRMIGTARSQMDRSIKSEKYPGRRLHIRAIIRDGKRAFIGSQSLRRLELEKRREVGVIVTDELVVRQMQDVFEKDWAQTPSGKKKREERTRRPRGRKQKLARGVVAARAVVSRQSDG